MKAKTETVKHPITCSINSKQPDPRTCTCGLWETMGYMGLWSDMAMLNDLAEMGRVILESDGPDSDEWVIPAGMPWTVTVVTYNKGDGTTKDELNEDEWLHYGGGSVGEAAKCAWLDLQPSNGWAE